jgi:hypothetical protein
MEEVMLGLLRLSHDGHVTYTNAKPSPKAKCTALSRDQRVSTVPGRATAQPYKDKVALHERNIEALKKEIGNLK